MTDDPIKQVCDEVERQIELDYTFEHRIEALVRPLVEALEYAQQSECHHPRCFIMPTTGVRQHSAACVKMCAALAPYRKVGQP